MEKIISLLVTLLVQTCVAGLVFLGFLLDPLLGVWIVGIYFFVIATFLTYYFLSHFSMSCRRKLS